MDISNLIETKSLQTYKRKSKTNRFANFLKNTKKEKNPNTIGQ